MEEFDIEETFLDYFDDIEDPRIGKNRIYSAHEILFVTICSIICGAESWRDIVDYGNLKLYFLRKYLPFANGIPSKNTFCRFFAGLNPESFKTCFVAWVKSLQLLDNDVIAIDGKAVRHSFDSVNETSAIHMVSAFAAKSRLVLGQQKVDDKSNEITAIPKLLNLLDLRGSIVTIDAMGTQKEIAKQIVDSGGDYILALKGNHSTLHDEVSEFLQNNDNSKYFKLAEENDCGHGRVELRKCCATEEIDWLGKLKFPGMNSIFCVESQRFIKGTETIEQRFYISSLSAEPIKLNTATRDHWAVENCLHWTLDMTFNEDASRIRNKNAPENIAMIRHTALNLLRQAKTKFKNSSLKGLRKKAGWDNQTLAVILGAQF